MGYVAVLVIAIVNIDFNNFVCIYTVEPCSYVLGKKRGKELTSRKYVQCEITTKFARLNCSWHLIMQSVAIIVA